QAQETSNPPMTFGSKENDKERTSAIGIAMKLTDLGGKLTDVGDEVLEHVYSWDGLREDAEEYGSNV
ncbi:hypothetical protein FRC02_005998, partial [Tulasnella sp. 418]